MADLTGLRVETMIRNLHMTSKLSMERFFMRNVLRKWWLLYY